MNNFIFKNPTQLIFGKGMIAELSKHIPDYCKLMVTFGGGSVKKNGVYDQVIKALEGKNYIEFWGIEPNPRIETLRKAIELGKAEGVDKTHFGRFALPRRPVGIGAAGQNGVYRAARSRFDSAGNRFGNEQRCSYLLRRD